MEAGHIKRGKQVVRNSPCILSGEWSKLTAVFMMWNKCVSSSLIHDWDVHDKLIDKDVR